MAEREPRPLSYSQISKFLTCEQAWELAYVQGMATSPNKYMFFGSLFHGFLENSYLKHRPLTNEELEAVWSELANQDGYIEAKVDTSTAWTKAVKLYSYYCDYWDGEFEKTEVVAVEQQETKDNVTGLADLLHTQYGGLWLREHKTRSQFTQQPADLQVHLYKFLWPELEGIEYNQIKTYEYKGEPDVNKLFLRVPVFSSEADQEMLDNLLGQVRVRMDEIWNGRKPVPSFVYYTCSRCDYKGSCPAVIGRG